MSTDLVLHSTEEAFTLAQRISQSALVPAAYRGKPADAAIAMLYGAEMGMPPMSSLQRIVVINGRPTMDAQGMVAMIRQAGHSVSGTVSVEAGAKITGTRGDNGDKMTVEWGPADAERAQLLKSDTYRKFPADMYWARAVSQLGRRLFADVLLGVSYLPDEAASIITGNGAAMPMADPETGEIEDAEVVQEDYTTMGNLRAELTGWFIRRGITDPSERLAYCVKVIDRAIATSLDLTPAEAYLLIATLKAEVGETAPIQEEPS